MNEILLIAAIVLALIFIPRINATRVAGRPRVQSGERARFSPSGRQRLALLVSFFWVVFWAVYFEPWQKEWKLFIYIGPGPILVVWSLFWAMRGQRKR